ncbi:MAG: molecular chaperone DnaJ [Gammaproteobacteria bacterium]|nr:molecular chaperone DnaJ [Gammaproteobacteria bacterium]
MSKLILFLLLLGGILFWWHWKNTPDPKQKKLLLQKTVIGVLVVALLLLVLTGRVHWIGAVFAGILASFRQMLPLIVRYLPVLTQAYRQFSPRSNPPNTSTVNSKIIVMTLDHTTGKLSGKVVDGEFKGCDLDEMSNQDLQNLYHYCVEMDLNSAKLLESYLSDRFGDQFKSQSNSENHHPAQSSNEMSISEALQVLGLDGEPGNDEVTEAYRKIMQKFHPDRGGNQYFAAKANQAREVLLKKIG